MLKLAVAAVRLTSSLTAPSCNCATQSPADVVKLALDPALRLQLTKAVLLVPRGLLEIWLPPTATAVYVRSAVG